MHIRVEDAVIIVVEDNPDNLFIVTDILKNELKVRYVNARASGRQLLKLLEKPGGPVPDLLLLDLQLPYEDGYAVLKQIRSHPTLQHLTVVAHTANVLPQDIARCRSAGFDGFIGKPLDPERFVEQILLILSGEAVWDGS